MTARRRQLEQELTWGLKKLPRGSLAYRRERHYMAAAIIRDLQHINELVPQLRSLIDKPGRLKKLIEFWQSKGNSIKTIRLKIALLRSLYTALYKNKEALRFPGYAELNLQITKKNSFCRQTLYPLEQIDQEELREYCTLQWLFGFKKMEVLQVTAEMVTANQIKLPRQITYNGKDRWISVITSEQKIALETVLLLPTYKKAPSAAELKYRSYLYQYYFKRYGISHQEHYRHHYINVRYAALLQAGQLPKEALRQLIAEVGYRQQRSLKEVLTCLNVS